MAEVGVVLVGHGGTASALLAAARSVLGVSSLPDVVAVDAGAGETADLRTRLGAALAAADRGKGVLLLADVFGASPCSCGIREAAGPLVVLSGLGLGMLLKLASVDRESQDPEAVACAVADSARRAIAVHCPPPPVPPAPAKEPAWMERRSKAVAPRPSGRSGIRRAMRRLYWCSWERAMRGSATPPARKRKRAKLETERHEVAPAPGPANWERGFNER